ncbi:unnamed protein product [Periconia digitata]|uniref:Uncharacterized protein n=1 Tax=Periconia digitata TaxID=1303443 RepID=A0A9W4XH24_9PLEO|nr:unnamed protein product [Periconia digitata]
MATMMVVEGLPMSGEHRWYKPTFIHSGGLTFRETLTDEERRQSEEVLALQDQHSMARRFMEGTWDGLCPLYTFRIEARVRKCEHGGDYDRHVTVELRFVSDQNRKLGTLGTSHCYTNGRETRRFGNWHFSREAGEIGEEGFVLGPRPTPTQDMPQIPVYHPEMDAPLLRTAEDWIAIALEMRSVSGGRFLRVGKVSTPPSSPPPSPLPEAANPEEAQQ